jgi:hypothetical protein
LGGERRFNVVRSWSERSSNPCCKSGLRSIGIEVVYVERRESTVQIAKMLFSASSLSSFALSLSQISMSAGSCAVADLSSVSPTL